MIAEVRKISETGKILRGKYCLLQEIGRGGEGVVYLARDTELGKRWCIKCTEKSPGIRLLCQLEHDHLPQVVDYWEEENCAVLVMEYIAGKTLQEVLRAGTVTRRQGMEWTRQLLHVVSYLHRQSPPLLHGDLKPENLMISTEGSCISLILEAPGFWRVTAGVSRKVRRSLLHRNSGKENGA